MQEFERINQAYRHSLYHYTKYKYIEEIINNGTLKFSHSAKVNDTSEIIFARRIIANIIKNIVHSEKFDKKIIKKLNKINKILEKWYDIRFLSLTRQRDNLSMWRWYGDDCKGIAIGLNFNQNNCPTLTCPYAPEVDVFDMLDVNYDEKDFIHYIERFFDILNQGEITDELLEIFTSYLIPTLPNLKDRSFEMEKEIRIVRFFHTIAHEAEKKCNYNGPLSPISQEKDYLVTLNLNAITEIWLGASLSDGEFGRRRDHIKKLLLKKSIDHIDIMKSNVSYISTKPDKEN